MTEMLLTLDVSEGESSSFLVGYPPLPGGQHVVERIPDDACSVEDRKEQI